MFDLFDSSAGDYLGGKLTFLPRFLSNDDADALYDTLFAQCQWRQEVIHVYGKDHPIPRLQTWLGREPIAYTYSGKTFVSDVWPPAIQTLAEKISTRAGIRFNSVLGNLYRNGQDSMGWHSDDEAELGEQPVIASLSLGATRDFALRERGATRQHSKIALSHGSLLIMHAGMQQHWQHSVPKRQGVMMPRINLTFRHIIHR